ncbi:hypothetical protein [Sphingomonas sp. Leaf412]|uniref:hypothetical protein n=1 Tax=Sphingomonas sp. Leaf412 TaxID=1736370 RepID=UPI0009E9A8DF|nr:hypothetical protein [Sphingomonas sp. Leaf412]
MRRRPFRLAAFLAGAVVALPALSSAQTPQRIRNVQLTGEQQCPKAAADEIVVCSRISPNEQYRIPKEMRNTAEPAAQNQAWANRTVTAEQVSRAAAGLPNTCSAVGTGGQTGCAQAYARAWAAERRAAERNDSLIPGGGSAAASSGD